MQTPFHPFDFFSKLNTQSQTYLHTHSKKINAPKNTILFYQGDICDTVLLLTKGEVKLYLQSDTSDEITLYTLNPGEQCIVNTSSLLSNTPASGTAETLSEIEGYLLLEKDVKHLMKLSDDYQKYIFSLYTIRMQSLATLIEDIKFKRLDQRLLEFLQKQNTNPIVMTHETIAEHLGSSRSVISRVLKELEHKNKLILNRGSITLC